MRWEESEVLVTSEAGEFHFLSSEDFRRFVAGELTPSEGAFAELKAKHFLWDTDSTVPLDLLATKVRTKRSFLEGFTQLHMFVVTLRCDHSCRYCQVSRVSADRARFDMSMESARRAVDLMFRSPARRLKVEIQGGESLLNFDLIRAIVELVQERNQSEGRQVDYVVATNLVPLTEEMLVFFRQHEVSLSTSLDGPASLHDANRPRPGGSSHAITVQNLERARSALGRDRVSALMTTTSRSLSCPVEIVDEYVRLGFDSIFLRPISPYGFAMRTGEALHYSADEFLGFYRTALAHIVELNRAGCPLVETFAQILLTKMLTPFPTGYVDLQSPSGAAVSAVAYNYDGEVYAADEARMLAEMGDRSFRLGNVHRDSYEEIFGGEVARTLVAASVVEALPGCCDCAFVPYCGADPIFHYATQGDIVGHRPTSAFCRRNMGILRHLFDLWRCGDEFVQELFLRWVTPTVDPTAVGER